MSSTETPDRRGSPAWMKILLVLSLAGNLAVLGVVFGHSLRDSEHRTRGSERVIDWIIGMVPEGRRDLAVAHFDAVRERIGAARAQRSERLPAVIAAMQAEPFDPASLDAALDAMFDRDTSGRTIVRESLISMLDQFTPEERVFFAANFEQRLSKRDDRRAD